MKNNDIFCILYIMQGVWVHFFNTQKQLVRKFLIIYLTFKYKLGLHIEVKGHTGPALI